MKRIMFTIAILGILGVLAAPALAGGGPNIIQVSHPYHGGYHGGYPGGYQGGYCDGWNGYRVYYPPVVQYRQDTRLFPNHLSLPRPAYIGPYYYYPRNSFYYATPGFSVGVGF